ncbi:MAG: hypothetical protein ABW133_12515 [Polyangiaceae bacterium]
MGQLRTFSTWFGGKAVLVAAFAFLAGCGHPASEEECRVILERIVDLELKQQKVNDPAEIAKRRNDSLGITADGGRPSMLDGCIGRHITDRALDCVRKAETSSDITEHCLQ